MYITGSIDMKNPDHEYLFILNLGLTVPSLNLVKYMRDAFAVLNATENFLINKSKLTSRNATKEDPSYMMECCNFS